MPGNAEAPVEGGPTVSAVIPAYNAAGTIARALDSVYAQTGGLISEVVVVDDGSEDRTAALVREQFPRALVVEQQNRGVSGARNAGVARATGEWIAFLDADDEWLPDRVMTQLRAAAQYPEAALVMCGEITVPAGGGEGRGTVAAAPAAASDEDLIVFTLRDWLRGTPFRSGVSLSCSAWLCRRSVFAELGGLDETLGNCEDFEFALRVAAHGHVTAAVPRDLFVRHMQQQSASQGVCSELRRAQMALEVVRRHGPGVCALPDCLSGDEYDEILQHYLTHLLYHLLAEGESEQAREVAAEAAGLGGSSHRMRQLRLVQRWPGIASALVRRVVHPLRRLLR